MSIEKFSEEKNISEEEMPEWVDQIKEVYEKVKNNQKLLRKLTKYAREDLEIFEELRQENKITELRYWENIRRWLHDNGVLDSWWGIENEEIKE